MTEAAEAQEQVIPAGQELPAGSFLAFLVSRGVLAEDEAATLPDSNRTLFRALLKNNKIGEDRALALASEYLQIPFAADMTGREALTEFAEKVPYRFAFNHGFIAVRAPDGVVELLMCEPFNLNAADEVAALLALPLRYCSAKQEIVEGLIQRAFQKVSPDMDGALDSLEEREKDGGILLENEIEDLIDIAERAPIVKLVSSVFTEALRKRASDVHFQPQEDGMQVRIRVDGLLHDLIFCPRSSQEAIISRIKVMGNMDIAEKRAPQDGRATLMYAGREIDLRISVIPCSHGEQVVLRILDRTNQVYELAQLGFAGRDYDYLERLIRSVHGIMLVTGPTGSGKSTTLYAALSYLNSRDQHIITVEDPIEYKFGGISQMQVQPKKNLTFANCLRSIVRQDPDIIMIGEIRDHETASLAVQAALTGHMVFSTLHTNDSPGSVTRLLDLGVEPYLVASSVIGVLAQRLVRVVCPSCAAPHLPDPKEFSDLGIDEKKVDCSRLRRGKGCESCLDTGFSGRCGIYELMVMSEEIRRLVTEHATATAIKDLALQQGLKTLRMDGAQKVLAGRTTVDEVLRVTQMDSI